ncbi:uncharacterized protein PAC_08647 [Phialocephala subalpina]|uniref:C2H2-type domain-containing protein n=1 Tax=Phialocephala subalpina TaxID=576137 RepID=A0A1L7X159_9HELO|nr:uncharacterized protein PAC_08647 [Phialocephala subalpina]
MNSHTLRNHPTRLRSQFEKLIRDYVLKDIIHSTPTHSPHFDLAPTTGIPDSRKETPQMAIQVDRKCTEVMELTSMLELHRNSARVFVIGSLGAQRITILTKLLPDGLDDCCLPFVRGRNQQIRQGKPQKYRVFKCEKELFHQPPEDQGYEDALERNDKYWKKQRQAADLAFFIESVQHLLEYLALLLHRIIQALLLCTFAEFPNRRRPRCTTMPWNIWPALVVLWGVCWMFHGTPDFIEEEANLFNSLFDEEALPSVQWSPPGLVFDPIAGHNQFQYNFAFDDGSRNLAYVPYMDQGVNQNFFNQDFPAQASVHEGSRPPTQFESPPTSQVERPVQPAVVVADGPSHAQLQSIATPSERPNLNGISLASPTPSSMAPGRPYLPTQHPQQNRTTSEQPQSPQQNGEGLYICTSCSSGKTFDILSKWKTHMDQHTRPYLCTIEGCPRGIHGFATKNELTRHERCTRHPSRSISVGPSRAARLEGLPPVTSVEKLAQEQSEMMAAPQGFVPIDKGKGRAKRTFTDESGDLGEIEESGEASGAGSGSKRVKAVNDDLDTSKSIASGRELVKENERLQQQLHSAKEEAETYQKEKEEMDLRLKKIEEELGRCRQRNKQLETEIDRCHKQEEKNGDMLMSQCRIIERMQQAQQGA